jgi:hypothetical protein
MKNETRVSTTLSAREYNSIYSNYAERPTWVKIQDLSDGNTILAIEMEHYGYNPTATYSPENLSPRRINFDSRCTDQYISLIEKFLEWEKKAQSRKDAFTKTIGKAPSWSHIGTSNLRFTFHSGNESSHLLAVSLDTGISGTTNDLFFDKRDAVELRNLLLKMQSGKINQSSISEVYN